jgi:very-short-patch-repair endonuclease
MGLNKGEKRWWDSPGMSGHKHTSETRAKMSSSFTPERKRIIGQRSVGNRYSIGHRVTEASLKAVARNMPLRMDGRAAYLRANPPLRDQYLMYWFDHHRVAYRYQVVIGGRYIADFVVGRMTIEVDSAEYIVKPSRAAKLDKRDGEIRAMRYGVLRIRR